MNGGDINPKRWVTISFVGAGLLAFFVSRQLLIVGSDYFRLKELEIAGVVSVLDVAAVGVGMVVFVLLSRSVKSSTFVSEVVIELSKVTWPVRKETLLSTVVVVVLLGIASLILAVFDLTWGTLSSKVLTF